MGFICNHMPRGSPIDGFAGLSDEPFDVKKENVGKSFDSEFPRRIVFKIDRPIHDAGLKPNCGERVLRGRASQEEPASQSSTSFKS